MVKSSSSFSCLYFPKYPCSYVLLYVPQICFWVNGKSYFWAIKWYLEPTLSSLSPPCSFPTLTQSSLPAVRFRESRWRNCFSRKILQAGSLSSSPVTWIGRWRLRPPRIECATARGGGGGVLTDEWQPDSVHAEARAGGFLCAGLQAPGECETGGDVDLHEGEWDGLQAPNERLSVGGSRKRRSRAARVRAARQFQAGGFFFPNATSSLLRSHGGLAGSSDYGRCQRARRGWRGRGPGSRSSGGCRAPPVSDDT
jgi:hypothetical protein